MQIRTHGSDAGASVTARVLFWIGFLLSSPVSVVGIALGEMDPFLAWLAVPTAGIAGVVVCVRAMLLAPIRTCMQIRKEVERDTLSALYTAPHTDKQLFYGMCLPGFLNEIDWILGLLAFVGGTLISYLSVSSFFVVAEAFHGTYVSFDVLSLFGATALSVLLAAVALFVVCPVLFILSAARFSLSLPFLAAIIRAFLNSMVLIVVGMGGSGGVIHAIGEQLVPNAELLDYPWGLFLWGLTFTTLLAAFAWLEGHLGVATVARRRRRG